jgi:heme exporter protein C
MTDTSDRPLHLLAAVSVAALLASAGLIFLYAPEDAVEGPVQRLFYLHVGTALAAFCCFALVLAGGVAYLWRRSLRGDRLARAGAVVGLVFTTTTFVLGMIWAKPVWNWDPSHTWDARITSTAVLWVIYAGYLGVRRFATPGHPAMRLAAVVGIVGFVDVPVVYFSVQWWRTLHPGPVFDAPGGPALPPEMLVTAVATTLAALLLAGALVAIWYRIEARRDERQERELAGRLGLTARAVAR